MQNPKEKKIGTSTYPLWLWIFAVVYYMQRLQNCMIFLQFFLKKHNASHHFSPFKANVSYELD